MFQIQPPASENAVLEHIGSYLAQWLKDMDTSIAEIARFDYRWRLPSAEVRMPCPRCFVHQSGHYKEQALVATNAPEEPLVLRCARCKTYFHIPPPGDHRPTYRSP
jgi:hypothetical protein